MKPGLSEEIRNSGHWRVNIRPADSGPKRPLGILVETVRRSVVSIRGWDYPHYSHRHDSEGGSENHGDYFENWTDWNDFKEFWRVYRSRQFISYQMLHEDSDRWNEGHAPGAALNSVAAAYSIFEFVEFAYRLSQTDAYPSGLNLNLRLGNAQGRRLHAGRNRVPFFEDKRTHGPEIETSARMSRGLSQTAARAIAVELCQDFFDAFNWNPTVEQIKNDQEKFYERAFSA